MLQVESGIVPFFILPCVEQCTVAFAGAYNLYRDPALCPTLSVAFKEAFVELNYFRYCAWGGLVSLFLLGSVPRWVKRRSRC